MASASMKPSKDIAPLQLYLVRLSPPCRMAWLYLLQNDIPHTLIDVDLSGSEKDAPEFIAKNPHKDVPILVDGETVVFEGQAIVRYLATTYTNNAGFGLSLACKALTDSLVSWASSDLHRAVGYCYTYPQFLERYRLPSEDANEALVESGIHQLTRHLENIENGYLAKRRFLTGDRLTVADSYVATVLLQAEWVDFKFSLWPKVEAWLENVRSQEYWTEVHASHTQFLEDLENADYIDD